MSCAGCLLSEREKQERIISVSKTAKDYAVTHNKMVVIYWLDETTIWYMEAEAAQAAGIQPLQYISPLRPHADGGIH